VASTADVGVFARPEPAGPGRTLEAAPGVFARVVGTVIGGDSHVAKRDRSPSSFSLCRSIVDRLDRSRTAS